MKKLLGIVLALFLVLLCSCGNRRILDFEYDTYKHIHCFAANECYDILSWKNNDIGIKVETKYGILYFSEGTYMLVGDKCPICQK